MARILFHFPPVMQVEELPTIYGNGLVCFGPVQDVSKNIAKLWTTFHQTDEEPMVIFQSRDLPEEIKNPKHKYSVLFGYYKKPRPTPGFKTIEIPGGKFLTVVHKGPYNKIKVAYDTLLEEINRKKYKVRSFPLEHYLNDYHHVGEDELLTKVMFPIE